MGIMGISKALFSFLVALLFCVGAFFIVTKLWSTRQESSAIKQDETRTENIVTKVEDEIHLSVDEKSEPKPL